MKMGLTEEHVRKIVLLLAETGFVRAGKVFCSVRSIAVDAEMGFAV
jgi:hypothetical protein